MTQGSPIRISEWLVSKIRSENIDGTPYHVLADRYDLHKSTIYRICNRIGRWAVKETIND